MVAEVVTGSPAGSVGIAKEDVIFQVGGQDVNDKDQFRRYVGEATQTESVIILIRDEESGMTGYMAIPIR